MLFSHCWLCFSHVVCSLPPSLSLVASAAMCDVTRHNFEATFPALQHLAKISSFVSVDTEFTVLCLGKENRSRYVM